MCVKMNGGQWKEGEQWLTRQQAAAYLGITYHQLNRLRHGKDGPDYEMRKGGLRYSNAALERWLKRQGLSSGRDVLILAASGGEA